MLSEEEKPSSTHLNQMLHSVCCSTGVLKHCHWTHHSSPHRLVHSRLLVRASRPHPHRQLYCRHIFETQLTIVTCQDTQLRPQGRFPLEETKMEVEKEVLVKESVETKEKVDGEVDVDLEEGDMAEHLFVMVNGLNGAASNWDVLKEMLKKRMGEGECKTALYASRVNRNLNTFGGICRCARRLSTEIKCVVRKYPNLKEISFLVHSMGGLITRYACGVNFDPRERTVFGLHPRHFVSMASPHLGCHVNGESLVPMLGWGQSIPFVGFVLFRPMVHLMTPFVIKHIYRRTGQQLFLLDAHNEGKDISASLVCRLVQDIPGEGYFLSALKEFRSRTCYANAQQDALVGWPNASIRRQSELPDWIKVPLGDYALHRADPLTSALWTASNPQGVGKDEMVPLNKNHRDKAVEFMLSRLQSMPWCRIDICFHGSFFPIFAHNRIQVTRRWMDSVGLPVVEHIAETIVKLEALVSESSSTN